MDNKMIDKLLCEKMNFTPEQIDTITFICKEVYKEMESNKGIQNEYSNFANKVATAEPIKENMKSESDKGIDLDFEKIFNELYNPTTSDSALNFSSSYRRTTLGKELIDIIEYMTIIFGFGKDNCVKSNTKILSIYKNKVDKLISENTDIPINLDHIFKRWEIQLSNISENHKSANCEIRLSLNNDVSISRFFDYRSPIHPSNKLIFALILYMKLRFRSKNWDLSCVFFKDFSEGVDGFSDTHFTPCVVFRFTQIENEPKPTKSKGGKK